VRQPIAQRRAQGDGGNRFGDMAAKSSNRRCKKVSKKRQHSPIRHGYTCSTAYETQKKEAERERIRCFLIHIIRLIIDL
jgi:hypothetical protein